MKYEFVLVFKSGLTKTTGTIDLAYERKALRFSVAKNKWYLISINSYNNLPINSFIFIFLYIYIYRYIYLNLIISREKGKSFLIMN